MKPRAFEEDGFLRSAVGGNTRGGNLKRSSRKAKVSRKFEDEMAYALAAEDSDEFFRRLRRIARRVCPHHRARCSRGPRLS